MTDDRNFDRIARAWLELGPNEAPDRAVSAVLQAVEATPQVRPLSQRLPWRYPTMNRLSLAASIAVAAVIVVGGIFVMRPKEQPGVGGPSPSASPTVTPSPTASSAAAAASDALPDAIAVAPEAAIAVTKPFALAFDGQAVWVLTDTGALVRLDPGSNTADPPIALDASTFYNGVSANATGVWATAWEPGQVYHIDPVTNEILAKIQMDHPKGILALDDAVWVANTRTGTVTRIDPMTDKVVATITVGAAGLGGPNWLASGFGSIWVGSPLDGAVVRIDPVTSQIQATISMARASTAGTISPCGGLAATADVMWISGCDGFRSVARIDPSTNTVGERAYLGGFGYSFAVIGGAAWVSVDRSDPDSDFMARLDEPTNRIDRALSPGSGFSGGGDMVVAAGSVWVTDGLNNQVLRLPLSAFGS